jgi:methionyl-tRNA formyltransferase
MKGTILLTTVVRIIRIIFMEKPGFAVASLKALIESEDEVVAVVCHQGVYKAL